MPAGVPQEIVDRIYMPVVIALKTSAMKDHLLKNGALAGGSTPAEFSSFIKSETAKWTKVAQFAKIKVD